MTTALPNITCTRCGTHTTWTAYCICGAYLEFFGQPPWHPSVDTELLLEEADPPDAGGITDAPENQKAPPVPEAATDSETNEPFKIDEPTTETQPIEMRNMGRKVDKPARWWRFSQNKEPSDPAPTDHNPSAIGPARVMPSPDADMEEDPSRVVVAQPIPQSVSSEEPTRQLRESRQTIAIDNQNPLGPINGTPCPDCGFRNLAATAYCARCGFELHLHRAADPDTELPSASNAGSFPRRRNRNIVIVVLLIFFIFVLVYIF